MTISTEQYAFLSSQAYNHLSVGQSIGNDLNSYRVLYTSDSAVDYHGVVFFDVENNSIIVANGGTDFTDLHLVKADAIMVAGEEPPQAVEAMATMRWAQQYAQQNGIADVSATGHSLGGSLAQLQAAQFGVHAETFDAYGTYAIADRYDLNPEAAMSFVVNHRSYYDPVSSITKQIGRTEYYMNASDYAHYMETGVLGMDHLDQLSSIAKAHSLDYFWNNKAGQASDVFSHNYWKDIDSSSGDVSLYMERLKHLGGQLNNLFSDIFSVEGIRTALAELFGIAKTAVSPLILDLDGDGVETTTLAGGVYFDQDGNGFAERSAWAGKDDGLLAWDRNGNGAIDDGGELFGNHTRLANGSLAANGFEALAELDGNHDGRIDTGDAVFSSLRVWRDGNSNGRADADELLSLEQAGVRSIDLNYSNGTGLDVNGNAHRQAGSYIRTDGEIVAVDDVWFGVDLTDSIDQTTTTIDTTIAALPDIAAFGNVRSLHQAMAHDTSGTLEALVERFGQEADTTQRHSLIEQILFAWTGADRYQANSRGGYLDDGRKLYALEAFMGETFVQSSGTNEGTHDPGPTAANELMQAYDRLAGQLYGQLMLQTHFATMLGMVGIKLEGEASATMLQRWWHSCEAITTEIRIARWSP